MVKVVSTDLGTNTISRSLSSLDFKPSPTTMLSLPVRALMKDDFPEPVMPIKAIMTSSVAGVGKLVLVGKLVIVGRLLVWDFKRDLARLAVGQRIAPQALTGVSIPRVFSLSLSLSSTGCRYSYSCALEMRGISFQVKGQLSGCGVTRVEDSVEQSDIPD